MLIDGVSLVDLRLYQLILYLCFEFMVRNYQVGKSNQHVYFYYYSYMSL